MHSPLHKPALALLAWILLLSGCVVPGYPYGTNGTVVASGTQPPAVVVGTPSFVVGAPPVVVAPGFISGCGRGYWYQRRYWPYRRGCYFYRGCYYGPRRYAQGYYWR